MSEQARIQSFYHASTGTWTHLVWDLPSGEAAVIDPVLDFDAASGRTGTESVAGIVDAAAAGGLTVTWALETHAHADHLTAADWLKRAVGAQTGIGVGICSVQTVFRDVYDLGDTLPPDGSQFDRLFEDGDTLMLGETPIRVLHTPGHTDDSVSYLLDGAAFIGDTLFAPAYGTARCDFPGGDAGRLFRSIESLLALGDETRLYLCHDYPAAGEEPRSWVSVAEQRASNVHVGAGTDESAFVAMRRARDAKLSMPALILPAVQVNIRAGRLPPVAANGTSYLKIPVDRF